MLSVGHACSADIILGTETWLREDIRNCELSLPDYFTVFRKDRTLSRGGGVLIAVRNSYQPSLVTIDTTLELLCVKTQFEGCTCVIGVCYRPPDSKPDFVDRLTHVLELIFNKFPQCVLLLGGDFNYPSINWVTPSSLSISVGLEISRFLRTLKLFHLTQMVTAPTRGHHILGLIFTNNPTNVVVQVLDEISDHRVVHCSHPLPLLNKKIKPKRILNYKKADIEKINCMLTEFLCSFLNEFSNHTTNENWIIYRDFLKKIENTCIPVVSFTSQTSAPWFSKKVKSCLNKKKRAYKKASQINSHRTWNRYKELARESEKAIKEAKDYYFNDTLPNLLKSDPKKFWRVLNPKDTDTIITLKDANGSIVPTSECAEVLNNVFSEVFAEEPPLDESCSVTPTPITCPSEPIIVTEVGVSRAIARLPLRSSPGPDGISSKLLKLTSHVSSFLLSLIFQQSLDSGCVPDDWKSGHVIPIYKSGDPSSPKNYRPISLTSVCCKLLEHIIYSHIMRHLNTNKVLFENQHGFRYKRSCQTQLFELSTDLHDSLHKSVYTDAVFIDFSKAFDRVPHIRLIQKINCLKLDIKTTRWIQEFLSGRSQKVNINNNLSSSCVVRSGVPQGSVLGPLLFLIYINDIANNITSTIRLFADDCIIYRQITCTDDVAILQSDLNTLAKWCHTWKMEINTDKTKVMSFSSNPNTPLNRYMLCSLDIKRTFSFKYLGVIFTPDLNWAMHIEHVTNKALKKLGFLKRRLYLANHETRLRAYTSLIRATLDYASIIWNPHTAILSDCIESIQNKAARFILHSYSPYQSVSALKQILNLPELNTRRKFFRLTFFHSLYHGITPFSCAHIFPAHYVSNRTDHARKVSSIFARTKKYQNSPFVLSVTEWNELPSEIAMINDPSAFQSVLRTFLDV